ncbi:hypothetical protein AWZ03_000850 [Drosophila navojoa]|uniref:Uncharacterized protein n=1 Tax=Drosophila navojoa TaxID=7232 RepID=A0A484BUX0_DRONA|nr:hypothetical protein AWZ03_000850 [Drosophila navojoa]
MGFVVTVFGQEQSGVLIFTNLRSSSGQQQQFWRLGDGDGDDDGVGNGDAATCCKGSSSRSSRSNSSSSGAADDDDVGEEDVATGGLNAWLERPSPLPSPSPSAQGCEQ